MASKQLSLGNAILVVIIAMVTTLLPFLFFVIQQKMAELEGHQINWWRQELSSHCKPFISISPEDSVRLAVRKLSQTKVHRLPVVDPQTGNAVYIITHKRILKFIHLFVSY